MDGGTGHVIEYAGSAIRDLSMEGRMTVCNMSIEAGARAGMVAPDETTVEYLRGRPRLADHPDYDRLAQQGQDPILLTSPLVRPYVRSIIERFRSSTIVMSQGEIHPKAQLRTLAQI